MHFQPCARSALPLFCMLFAAGLTLAAEGAAGASAPPQQARQEAPWFARVGGTVIPAEVYQNAVRSAYRNKFYHGKPPEAEVENLLRETGQEMIDKVLLEDEAKRRAIQPDQKDVQAQIDAYERRYGNSPTWPQMREQALPGLRTHLEGKSILKVLEQQVRTVAEPSDEALTAYYNENKNLFTEPAKNKVSLIMLRVDPSSPKEVWATALADGEKIVTELRAGADFAQMAVKRSNDKSADNGGDLGYLHTGMLPDVFQEKVDSMKPGEISDAMRALEGILIYRLDDRIPAALRPFESVKARAGDLLKRDLAEKAWKQFIADLRTSTKIEIAPDFQKNMAPPPAAASAAAAAAPK